MICYQKPYSKKTFFFLTGRENQISDWYQLIFIVREGNGTPLQYSCLENPMDGGAW